MKDTLKDVWEGIRDFFMRDWTPAEKVLVILCCILIGVVKGFCLAPVKRGISFGNNNGNTYLDERGYTDEE